MYSVKALFKSSWFMHVLQQTRSWINYYLPMKIASGDGVEYNHDNVAKNLPKFPCNES